MIGLRRNNSILLNYSKGLNMKFKLVVLVASVMGLVSIKVSSVLAENIMSDYKMYKKESECVANLVSLGVERKHISTANGTCVEVTD
jgi:hypothetical protein